MSRSDTPGATRRISATTIGTSERLTVPTTPRVAWPVSRPCSIDTSLLQRLDLAANGACPVEHPIAELGGHGATAPPHEELDAELGFELAHVLGDVRLHGVEAVGGGGEAALFGHGQEGLELANVHVRASFSGPRPPRGLDQHLSVLAMDPIA